MRDVMHLDPGFLSASLDEEETSRTEKEEDQAFVVVDVPYQVEKDDEEEAADPSVVFTTIPLGIIITPEYFVTISSKQSALLDSLASGTVRGVQTRMRTRFLLTILFRIAQRFLVHLRMIEKISSSMYYGMNVTGLQMPVWWFPTVISIVMAVAALLLLIKFKMFK